MRLEENSLRISPLVLFQSSGGIWVYLSMANVEDKPPPNSPSSSLCALSPACGTMTDQDLRARKRVEWQVPLFDFQISPQHLYAINPARK